MLASSKLLRHRLQSKLLAAIALSSVDVAQLCSLLHAFSRVCLDAAIVAMGACVLHAFAAGGSLKLARLCIAAHAAIAASAAGAAASELDVVVAVGPAAALVLRCNALSQLPELQCCPCFGASGAPRSEGA